MSKTIVVKKDEESGEYYFDFEDIKDMFTNPDLIDSYSIETRDDGGIILEFFDKDENKIVPDKI